MHSVIYSGKARTDLANILRYIALDNPERARSFVEDIVSRCELLTLTPEMGLQRDDLRRGLRVLLLDRRVVVAYRILGDDVRIVRVFHGRQDYESILRGSGNA